MWTAEINGVDKKFFYVVASTEGRSAVSKSYEAFWRKNKQRVSPNKNVRHKLHKGRRKN